MSSVMLPAQENVEPLRNWATPLYWRPNQAEKKAAAPQIAFSANQVSPDALTFVAITPCRLVDTRGAAAGFNGNSPFSGPSIPAGQTVTFPVQLPSDNTEPAPCGAIPSIAEAYSFNVTIIPHSAGAVDYITIWPAGATKPVVSTLDDVQGLVVANAAIVPAGTPSGGVSVYNAGPATTDVVIDMNGFFASPTDLSFNTALGQGSLSNDTTGTENTAVGYEALQANTLGKQNMASGTNALQANTIGYGNTAAGADAMLSNTTGSFNTASGYQALWSNTTGLNNTASGVQALFSNTTGQNKSANGFEALLSNTTGSFNTADGPQALASNTAGIHNVGLGNLAGFNAPATNGESIYIGSEGSASDANGVIYLGTQGTQNGGTYIAGIYGATSPSGAEVYINASGQLGTVLSSGRFKEDITDMGNSSSKLLQLHPVNFFYKPEYDDGSHLLQYGLIAEEVAKIYPEMVAYGNDGRILTVRYQNLDGEVSLAHSHAAE
jgi:Chaperone of endosialidase